MRVSDDFSSFRAAHSSVLEAIDACDRPDWLVQLAWEAADPKEAVRIGLGAARLSSRASDTLWLFNPNPDRLETIAAWAEDDDDEIARSSAFARSFILASFPAVALAYFLVSALVTEAWTAKYVLSLVGSIVALEIVFTSLVRRTLNAIVRRRAARLDGSSALAIVLDEVRKGIAAEPRFAPIVVKSTGNRLRRLLSS